jgi:hypothetical protein
VFLCGTGGITYPHRLTNRDSSALSVSLGIGPECNPRARHGTVIHAAVAARTWVLRWAIPFAASTRITGVTTLMRGSEAVKSWPASGGPTLDAASEALDFETELRPLLHGALRLAAAMLLD